MKTLLAAVLLASPAFASVGTTLSDAALEQTTHRVVYDPAYVRLAYPGGDVAPDKGACTDVVIRAFRKAGVDLQVAVHEDVLARPRRYTRVEKPDTNIDHRRVPNLMTYFAKHSTMEPITDKPSDYAPGDVVAWDLGGGLNHIGLVVDRAAGGRPMIVHNIGAGPQLEDALFSWRIIGHYRYDR
ncbi:MAG: DUF1287 domain-containing protein [Elusimicrobia bacterium]|nr:DUF1287 domain-containing protein [Elusimicrobiota bacterium]